MLSSDFLESQLPKRTGKGGGGKKAERRPGWNHPVMLAAKLLLWRMAVHKAGSEERLLDRTDWRKAGIKADWLLSEVRRFIPSFDEVWGEQLRTDSKDHSKREALRNRLYYMYRRHTTQGYVPEITVEHPTRSKKLAPFREVSRLMFNSNRPWTRAEIEASFS